MTKEILMFCHIEIEKLVLMSPVPLRDVDVEKVLVLVRFLLVKKTINTLSVTCIMIIKLSYYM